MILVLAALLIVLFGSVVFFGAPYLPTKRRQIEVAIEMLKAGKGSVIVDFGSGDGVFLKAAARKGAVVYGYELNPLLCAVAWLRCWRYRDRVHIRCTNFWQADLPKETTGVYLFLITRFMKRLDHKLEAEAKRLGHPLNLASFTFAIPGRQAKEVKEAVFLYEYAVSKHNLYK